MFTGLVSATGTVVESGLEQETLSLAVQSPWPAHEVTLGESILVSGVCLSVRSVETSDEGSHIIFDVMAETLAKTTLGTKQAGARVNLERSLAIGDRLGGHFVFGHVDGIGEVTDIDRSSGYLVTVAPPRELMRYMAPQGSVALDGVSLTVARRTDTSFTVALIPDTIERTTLGALAARDAVNVEADMLAKYAAQILGI